MDGSAQCTSSQTASSGCRSASSSVKPSSLADVTLSINGGRHRLSVDTRTSLLDLLRALSTHCARGADVHIVMDNYATTDAAKIKAWLARRPQYHVHFTPTSASWINQVQRWFAEPP